MNLIQEYIYGGKQIMKKVKALISIALIVAMFCSIGTAVANHAEGAVAGYHVDCDNYISANKKNCGASTAAANNVVDVTVSLSYYWMDPMTGERFSNGGGNGGSGGAGVGGPTLTGTKIYYKVVSDHYASYQDQSYTCPGLTTIIQ